MTRCKFKCDEVSKTKHWDKEKGYLYGVKMSPVTSGSEENKKFFSASPSGQFILGCIHPDLFDPGKEYFIDISLAE